MWTSKAAAPYTWPPKPGEAGMRVVEPWGGSYDSSLFTNKSLVGGLGGLEHDFYFPFHIWDVILPIDFHIFQDG